MKPTKIKARLLGSQRGNMELDVDLVREGQLLLEPMEFLVRERDNSRLSVLIGHQAPRVLTGKLCLTTDRLLFLGDPGVKPKSLSLKLTEVRDLRYIRVASQRKLVTLETYTFEKGDVFSCTAELYLFGSNLKHLIASLFSIRDYCQFVNSSEPRP